ncbi:MAG: RluA family pseudouridine synthase [Verrucomicrobiae bacterium]|nr:RluA family pseudouridine synthase [Verrucomicrobiae bacterium]
MFDRKDTITVEKSAPSVRLDVSLHTQFPAVSRSAIQRLIESGDIRVNGRRVKPTHRPRAGELIEINWPAPRAAEAHPEPIPLDILYEDECLLVLNKPAGMVVHPAAGHHEHTLVNALLYHCKGQLSGVGGVARPGIVHRLDKDTSGCLVVAKTDAAHLALAAQFARRQVEKIYHAFVCGVIPRDSGEIRAAIARHPTHRKRMAVRDESVGRQAHTKFRVLERLEATTLVEVTMLTGRTHQIRVHFQFIGYPLLGDPVYGPRQTKRVTELTNYAPPRLMLHASRLSFTHPLTQEPMSVEAPWPDEFRDALRALRARG